MQPESFGKGCRVFVREPKVRVGAVDGQGGQMPIS